MSLYYKRINIVTFLVSGNVRFLAKDDNVPPESDGAKQAYFIRKNDNLPSILVIKVIRSLKPTTEHAEWYCRY
jgi:hypothetical protein